MERFTRQPGSPSPQQPAGQPTPHTAKAATKTGGTKSLGSPTASSKLLVVSLIIAAIAVLVALTFGVFKSTNSTSAVKTDKYQAVFLQNGQVYFGHLSHINNEYAQLKDIYYLQVQQQVQPNQQQAGQEQQQTQPQISLAKLGNELHGPEDVMYITRDQIVFWENLKDDGQVVQAIQQYKENGNQNTTDQTQTDQTDQTTQPQQ